MGFLLPISCNLSIETKENLVKIIGIGILIVISALSIITSLDQNSETQNLTTPSPSSPLPNAQEKILTQLPPQDNSTFSQISLADQSRMREIITGVIQNSILVTPEINNELKNIFKKYNATEEEINSFSIYGPAFAVAYQQSFFIDAFQAVSSRIPVKSKERLDIEKEALSRGLITTERINANDEEMRLIASHQPITGADGKQVIFTEDNIMSTINNLGLVVDRLVLLFKF